MSYIAFELDALNKAPAVARAARVSEDVIIGGLARMWAYCFREQAETLTALQVAGFFAVESDVVAALAAFGFLEEAGEVVRVRGADRYKRVADARRKGAEKTNAARRERTVERRSSDAQATLNARSKSVNERTLNDALTPSTEHRAPKVKALAPAAPSQPRDSDRLAAVFSEVTGQAYLWQGAKDGAALAELLKAATLEQVLDRWRRGLKASADDWASCRTVAQLRQKWNDLADAKPAAPVSIEHQPSRFI